MSFFKNDRLIPVETTFYEDADIVRSIASALRQDYGEIHSAVKTIGRQTGAHPRAIRNWWEGVNAPNCTHLVTLGRHAPVLVETFLGLTGHRTIWEYKRRDDNGYDYAMRVRKVSAAGKVYDDKSVSINVTVSIKDAADLNQRQLWFLGCLQGGKSPRPEVVAEVWDVNLRTARRDMAGLVAKGLVQFTGANKNGFYKLIGL